MKKSETAGELMSQIKSVATDVYKTLGAGYSESVYEEAMAVEFRQNGIKYDVQKTTEVFYKEHKIGTHELDFIVENSGVVELKAGASISKSHIAQLQSYLKTLGLTVGIVINFPYPDKECPDFEVVNMEKE
jgi:GxxExxY protein